MQTLKPGPRDRDVRRSSWMGSGLVYPIGEQADILKARFDSHRIGPFSFGLRKKGAAKVAAKVQGLAFCEYPHLPVWARLFHAPGAYAFRRTRFDANPIGPVSFASLASGEIIGAVGGGACTGRGNARMLILADTSDQGADVADLIATHAPQETRSDAAPRIVFPWREGDCGV